MENRVTWHQDRTFIFKNRGTQSRPPRQNRIWNRARPGRTGYEIAPAPPEPDMKSRPPRPNRIWNPARPVRTPPRSTGTRSTRTAIETLPAYSKSGSQLPAYSKELLVKLTTLQNDCQVPFDYFQNPLLIYKNPHDLYLTSALHKTCKTNADYRTTV